MALHPQVTPSTSHHLSTLGILEFQGHVSTNSLTRGTEIVLRQVDLTFSSDSSDFDEIKVTTTRKLPHIMGRVFERKSREFGKMSQQVTEPIFDSSKDDIDRMVFIGLK